jgi:hypothetical protein
MTRRARLALATASLIALSTLGAALPSTAAPTDEPDRAASTASEPSAEDVRPVSVKKFDPNAGTMQPIHTFMCPPRHPWLKNLNAGWGLPGVQVRGEGYLAGDVKLEVRAMRDRDGLVVGWDGNAEAVKVHADRGATFEVVANCTDDRAEAYTNADEGPCPHPGWHEVQEWMRITLERSGRGNYELSTFDGSTAGGATDDLRCITSWTYTFSHPTDPGANSIQVELDLVRHTSKMRETTPRRPLPKTDMTPARALEVARAHGYDRPFHRVWLAPAQAGTGAAEYEFFTDESDHILVDAATGRVSSFEFPELPDSVIAVRADRYSSGGTYPLKAFTCPTEHHPYLWNADFSVGLAGAKFRTWRKGGTMHAPTATTTDGLVSGWQAKPGGITVDDFGKDNGYLYGLCTNDRAAAYPG